MRYVHEGSCDCPCGTYPDWNIWRNVKDISAAELGATVIKEALVRAGISANKVDEVNMGNVGQVAENAFIAGMCALQAGLPNTLTAS